jgi:nitrite reductase (NADH) large subunit
MAFDPQPQRKQRLVVVGNGMAGMRTIEELLKLAPDLYDITVVGAEPHPNYNRILLSPVLAGEQTIDDIVINPVDWYREQGIKLHLGTTVTKIVRAYRKVVALDRDGATLELPYDRLLLATGSNPFMLPIPGAKLPGVITYRDIADTHAMIDASATLKRAVVIGGGLLGLEAANGLKLRGMDVTVVHVMPWLMERQLDRTAGDLLQKSLEDRGLKFLMQAQTTELVADAATGRVRALRYRPATDKDATVVELETDLVVMAVGIRPNTTLAEAAGLHCNRGISQRHAADLRSAHLRGRRMRRTPRYRVRSGGAAIRAGQGRRQPSRADGHRPLSRLGDEHQAQGHRHRSLLRR